MSCGDVDSFQDDPQHKVMKYLVFETILSSFKLLTEVQIIIPKTRMWLEIKGQTREVH